VGNSLADLIADITVASFAPIMAFSACIGGPMLNILLGIGGSGTYIIRQTGGPFSFNFPTTLMVSSIGLLFLLVITVLFVPYNNYWLTKRWGVFLICCYFLIMALNIIVEVKGL
jgi:solute carrier family 24 (sodium/potassium/calcium exchanger), member 6